MKGLMYMVLMNFSLFGCVSHADPRLNVNQNLEMPEYKVLKSNAALELRAYKSFLTAQVEVSGSFDAARGLVVVVLHLHILPVARLSTLS